jgi:hypothetical protein
MTRYLFILIMIPTILSCKKETLESQKTSASYFWVPIISIDKGNEAATLYLTDPRPFTEYIGIPPSSPDYFEVFYSTDNKSFTFFKRFDYPNDKINIINLTNGTPYYFMVTTHKGSSIAPSQDTVMTIPSTGKKSTVLNSFNFSAKKVLLSQDKTYITFTSYNYPGIHNGSNILYYKPVLKDSIYMVEENANSAHWSPADNSFVYIANRITNNTVYPNYLKLFDVNTKKITTLLEIDWEKYYVLSPVFSPNGKQIDFLSGENSHNINNLNLWTIDLETKRKSKVADFESMGFLTRGNLDWTPDGEYLYLDGHYKGDYKNHIYRFNIASGSLEPVIKSPWDDSSPAISPDNSKIAFISNRSGYSQLWIYNLVTAKFEQITGGNSDYFYPVDSNIEWISDHELLITININSTSKAGKIIIE